MTHIERALYQFVTRIPLSEAFDLIENSLVTYDGFTRAAANAIATKIIKDAHAAARACPVDYKSLKYIEKE